VRKLAPAGARFIGYGHRLSFAYISSTAWSGGNASRLAESFARDVTAWDQLGCLSPHVLYVENGGTVTPVRFAEMLARELERMEGIEPRGCVSSVDASAIASRRSLYEIRAAHSEETRLWCSRDSTAWTVVFETEPRFQVSCLNRFVYVKPVANLTDALQAADSVRGKVSTVGLAAGRENFDSLATQLARWGAARISPLGKMQAPPLCWRHDGRPVLAELVSWTDVERD
ncbi:MAG TPA: acyl-CoA reductase, partial [Verrucomicrobiae bacterium]|nr:acyl-CoA reductase [Verrucomicrobiae bacterium]